MKYPLSRRTNGFWDSEMFKGLRAKRKWYRNHHVKALNKSKLFIMNAIKTYCGDKKNKLK